MAMLVVDPQDGRIVSANDAASRFYGWSRAQLAGKPIADINTLPPAQIDEAIRRALSHKAIRFEFRHRLADGTTRDVEVFSGPVAIDGRQLLHSIVYDVTEYRRAQVDARRWQRVFEVAQFGLAYHEAASDTFEDVNDCYAQQRGYRREELRGMPVIDAYAPEEREAVLRRLAEADATGHVAFESVHQRKDGSGFPVLVEVASIRDASGRTTSGSPTRWTSASASARKAPCAKARTSTTPSSTIATMPCCSPRRTDPYSPPIRLHSGSSGGRRRSCARSGGKRWSTHPIRAWRRRSPSGSERAASPAS